MPCSSHATSTSEANTKIFFKKYSKTKNAHTHTHIRLEIRKIKRERVTTFNSNVAERPTLPLRASFLLTDY